MSSARKAYPNHLVEDAITAILTYFSSLEAPINEADLMDRSRDAYTVKVRAVVMYFLKTEAHLSYPQIGRRFERDHTSVIGMCRRVHDLVENEDLADIIEFTRRTVAKKMLERHEALMAASA